MRAALTRENAACTDLPVAILFDLRSHDVDFDLHCRRAAGDAEVRIMAGVTMATRDLTAEFMECRKRRHVFNMMNASAAER